MGTIQCLSVCKESEEEKIEKEEKVFIKRTPFASQNARPSSLSTLVALNQTFLYQNPLYKIREEDENEDDIIDSQIAPPKKKAPQEPKKRLAELRVKENAVGANGDQGLIHHLQDIANRRIIRASISVKDATWRLEDKERKNTHHKLTDIFSSLENNVASPVPNVTHSQETEEMSRLEGEFGDSTQQHVNELVRDCSFKTDCTYRERLSSAGFTLVQPETDLLELPFSYDQYQSISSCQEKPILENDQLNDENTLNNSHKLCRGYDNNPICLLLNNTSIDADIDDNQSNTCSPTIDTELINVCQDHELEPSVVKYFHHQQEIEQQDSTNISETEPEVVSQPNQKRDAILELDILHNDSKELQRYVFSCSYSDCALYGPGQLSLTNLCIPKNQVLLQEFEVLNEFEFNNDTNETESLEDDEKNTVPVEATLESSSINKGSSLQIELNVATCDVTPVLTRRDMQGSLLKSNSLESNNTEEILSPVVISRIERNIDDLPGAYSDEESYSECDSISVNTVSDSGFSTDLEKHEKSFTPKSRNFLHQTEEVKSFEVDYFKFPSYRGGKNEVVF